MSEVKLAIAQLVEHLTVECLRQSDGPWFDSGWPDCLHGRGRRRGRSGTQQSLADITRTGTIAEYLTPIKNSDEQFPRRPQRPHGSLPARRQRAGAESARVPYENPPATCATLNLHAALGRQRKTHR